jgi:hypothetical protein
MWAAAGQPFGQHFGIQRLTAALVHQAGTAQAHQGVQAGSAGAKAPASRGWRHRR